MLNLLIQAAKIFLPESRWHGQLCDLSIEHGCLKQIGTHGSLKQGSGQEIIDAREQTLAPSFVDLSFTQGEPGLERMEDLESASRLAFGSGYGHLFLTPDTSPSTESSSQVRHFVARSEVYGTDFHPIGRISHIDATKSSGAPRLTEMIDMARSGAMAFSNGNTPISSYAFFLRALQYSSMTGCPIISDPLDSSLSMNGQVHSCAMTEQMGLPGVLHFAENLAIQNQIAIAKEFGMTFIASNVSSRFTIDSIRQAKSEGIKIQASVPILNCVATVDKQSEYDTHWKTWPVLREETDRKAILEALRNGTIDFCSSNHMPVVVEEKMKEFALAEAGVITLQYTFSLLLQAFGGSDALDDVLDILSIRPRKAFPVNQVELIPGEYADYVIVDPNKTWVYSREKNLSKSENSPFFGQEFKGFTRAVIKKNNYFDYGTGFEE
jgi:dihydroorotase